MRGELVRAVPLRIGFVFFKRILFGVDVLHRLQSLVEFLDLTPHTLGSGEAGSFDVVQYPLLVDASLPVFDAGVQTGRVEVLTVDIQIDVLLDDVVDVLLWLLLS